MRKIITLIGTGIVLVIVLASGLLAFLTLPLAGNHKVLVVLSGSMEPEIQTGSLVIVKPFTHAVLSPVFQEPQYTKGDIVSFTIPNAKQFVTHRIVDVQNNGSGWMYTTKGDANNEPDSFIVPESQIIGKSIIHVPYVGRLMGFAKTKQGIALLIMLPAVVVLFTEFVYLFSVIRLPATWRIGTFYSVGLLMGIAAMTSSTQAFFSDTAVSTNNIFQTDSSFGTDHIVINEVYYDVCTPSDMCGNNPQNEWIELFNPTGSTIDLSGWTITDNHSTDTIPSGTSIVAGNFVILTPEVRTFDIWTSVPANQRVIFGSNIGNGLADPGDRVILKNVSGVTIDSISYGDDISQFNPSATDVAKGHSIERNPDGVDTNTAADFIDRNPPTPGS